MQQRDKGMCDRRPVVPRVELLRERVEGQWVFGEVLEFEDGFGVREIEALKVGVESCVGGAEVGDAG
jgi:hypothetical protein